MVQLLVQLDRLAPPQQHAGASRGLQNATIISHPHLLFRPCIPTKQVLYGQIAERGRVNTGNTGTSRGLQNATMQLRKACNHPYLFLDGGQHEPDDPEEVGSSCVRPSSRLSLISEALSVWGVQKPVLLSARRAAKAGRR